jgi:broad specificity phosphatase PhoE
VNAVLLLLRHAAHDDVGGYLAGRREGVRLGAAGRAQAARLAARLLDERIDAIVTSPRERAQETAAAIAALRGCEPPIVTEELDEIDFGSWTGRSFDELDRDLAWRRWNEARSLARTPAGDSMRDAQQRALSAIERFAAAPEPRTIAFVSHADVIKAIVSYYLGLPLDAWPRFDIAPASITRVVLNDWSVKIVTLNEIVS